MGGDRRRSLPTIDISPNDSDVEIVSGGPPPRRRGRSILSKVLFLAIFSVALTLLACEISIAFKVPWLDPRPWLLSLWRFALGLLSRVRGR
jgi:hypothetical protein